jgi:hypothetical protein
MTAILHTLDQLLQDHLHLHFLFPVKALSSVFRGKVMDSFEAAYAKNELIFPGKTESLGTGKGFRDLVNRCHANDWVVHIKEPIDNPEYVLDYMGRNTHRVAISNNRIVALEDGRAHFTFKNRDSGEIKEERLGAVEFIRRFLLHVLPKGFMRIRNFGFLANRYIKHNVQICRGLLGQSAELPEGVHQSIRELMCKLTGTDITQCSFGKKGTMIAVMEIPKGAGPSAFTLLHPL